MKIESGIPFEKKSKYPFKDMKVGDSFEFSLEDRAKVYQASMLYRIREDDKKEFSTRKTSRNKVRLWRVR